VVARFRLAQLRPVDRSAARDVAGAESNVDPNPRACYCAHYKHWRWHTWDEAASGNGKAH
jgi:hypothetical protein